MRKGRRSPIALTLAALVGLSPLAARAQQPDTAAAQALFDQARELVQKGKLNEACPKFEESNRLDPGIGTQFHLADCYEQSGRVASAWALFLDVASQARATGQVDREKVGQQRAEKLLPRLPRLAVDVPEASKATGLEIRRNGILVGTAQWGVPIPIDPGEVEVTMSAANKQTLRHTLRVEEGTTVSYSVPVLQEAEASTAPPAVKRAEPPAAARPTAPAAAPRETSASGDRGWSLGLGAVGVVGLGVGTAFAILAKNKYEDSKSDCDKDDVNSCGPVGIEQRDDARTKGDIATIGFIAGGVALAGAGAVWLMSGGSAPERAASRSSWRAAPVLAPGTAALFVRGDY